MKTKSFGVIFIVATTLSISCSVNTHLKPSYAPFFDRQGDSHIAGSLTHNSFQADAKFAGMENIAFGVNGFVSHNYLSESDQNGTLSNNPHRKNQGAGGQVGYFNHKNFFYYDVFSGYGKSFASTKHDDYYDGSSNRGFERHAFFDSEKFSLQADFGFKFKKNKVRGRPFYFMLGSSLFFEYEKVDEKWNTYDYTLNTVTDKKGYFVTQKAGYNFFFRFGGEKVKFEVCNGFLSPLEKSEISSSGLYEESVGLVSVNVIVNISAFLRKKGSAY